MHRELKKERIQQRRQEKKNKVLSKAAAAGLLSLKKDGVNITVPSFIAAIKFKMI